MALSELHFKDDDKSSIVSVIGSQRWIKEKLEILKEIKSLQFDQKRTKISEHLGTFRQLVGDLWRVGMALDDSDILCFLLLTLPYEYENIVLEYCQDGLVPFEVVEARLLISKPPKLANNISTKSNSSTKSSKFTIRVLKEEKTYQPPPPSPPAIDEPSYGPSPDPSDDEDMGWHEPAVIIEVPDLDFTKDEKQEKDPSARPPGKRRGRKSQTGQYMECDICGKYYYSRNHFLKHVYKHFNDFPCKFCGQKFTQRDEMAAHKKICSKSSTVCTECGVVVDNIKLKLHMQKHGDPLFQCSNCLRGFRKKQSLSKHMKTLCEPSTGKPTIKLSPNERVPCKVCHKKMTRASLIRHMNMHAGKKTYECEICGEGFYWKETALLHGARKHGLEKYPCTLCDRQCVNRAQLNRHMKVHSSDRQTFSCEHCGRKFTAAHSLKRHLAQVHKIGAEIGHCEYCFKVFYERNRLKAHVREHKAQKGEAKQCGICAKSFASTILLKSHLKLHAAESNLECTLCSLSFPSNKRLSLHYKSEMHLQAERMQSRAPEVTPQVSFFPF